MFIFNLILYFFVGKDINVCSLKGFLIYYELIWYKIVKIFKYFFKVIFEGVRGISYFGDIVIDDVFLIVGSCL